MGISVPVGNQTGPIPGCPQASVPGTGAGTADADLDRFSSCG
jgi:hypothetical protein